ncbi:MAG: hypothetical protein LKG25_02030 [Prevotella sp.]|nr:hypothetical protein [Prevotella sp.]MCI1281358.1 hypothetical protein [Prevotella sp.]
MRKNIFLQIFFIAISFQAQAQVVKNHNIAESLNRKLSTLLVQLTSLKDSNTYYKTAEELVKTAVLCEKYDGMPDKKSRVKPLFRNENSIRVSPVRETLVDAGISEANSHHYKKALQFYELYINTSDNPLFDKYSPKLGLAAYDASLLAYGMKNYNKADQYADIALQFEDYAQGAAEVKVNCMQQKMCTHTDSLKYVIALLELHDKAPDNQNYRRKLIEYFQTPGHRKELGQFVDDELQKYPNNKFVWGIKGEMEMKDHHWEDAISAFKCAEKIDTTFVPALYNIGISYCSQVQEKKDSIIKADKQLSKDKRQGLITILTHAKDYFEKSKRIDPEQKTVSWAFPLYQVYNVLEDKRAEEIKKLIKN